MKIPEKQWIKKVDAAMILVIRRCLRNYLLIFFGLSHLCFDEAVKPAETEYRHAAAQKFACCVIYRPTVAYGNITNM